MSDRAVVSLNGEFVLATHYGGSPICIGSDFGGKESSVQGIVRAGRFWEIGYLLEEHRDLVASLVPEARFTYQDTGSKFCVRLVKNKEEYCELAQPQDPTGDYEYDVLPEGVFWTLSGYSDVRMPLAAAFKSLGLDPDYNFDLGFRDVKDFLQALVIDKFRISRNNEMMQKYVAIAKELVEIGVTENDWELFDAGIKNLTETSNRISKSKQVVDTSRKIILDTCTDPNKVFTDLINQFKEDSLDILDKTESEDPLSPEETQKIKSLSGLEDEVIEAFKSSQPDRERNIKNALAKKTHITDQMDAGSLALYSRLSLDEEFMLFMLREGILHSTGPIEFLRRRYMK